MLRKLPWARYMGDQPLRGLLRELPQHLLPAVFLIILPTVYLVHLVRHRQWSLRQLLWGAPILAMALLVLGLPATGLPATGQPLSWQHVAGKFAAGLVILPALVFVASVIHAATTGRWRRVLGELAISAGVAIVWGVAMIVAEASEMPRASRYASTGWYLIWFQSIYLIGLGIALFMGARWAWHALRRGPRATIAASLSAAP